VCVCVGVCACVCVYEREIDGIRLQYDFYWLCHVYMRVQLFVRVCVLLVCACGCMCMCVCAKERSHLPATYFLCDMSPMYACGLTWYTSVLRVTRVIPMRDITHSYARHDSFLCGMSCLQSH